METYTIIYLVVAVLFTAVITYIITSKSNKKDSISELKSGNTETDKKTIATLENKLADKERRINELNNQISSISEKSNTPTDNTSALLDAKRKIETLEEEIEDLEDENDNNKRKFKKEKESLEETINDKNKEIESFSNKIEEIKEELSDKTKEIAIKNDSISFIQEILCAKGISDQETQKLHQRVDLITNFIRNEIRDAFNRCDLELEVEDDAYFFNQGLEQWAITSKKRWIQNKTSIAFVGEFSAGKTSIVNRIISQDDPKAPTLPVSTKASTAIPTYISGGLITDFTFVAPNNEQKSITENSFKRVKKEVLDQVKGISSLIKYFVMTYKNDNLKEISILDTPGFNSNDSEDAERTIEVINECDALFWVFDVNAGEVNRQSIKLIKEHLHKPLYVVINKIDTKAESEVKKVLDRIKKTFEDNGIKVNDFISFSSKAPISNILTPLKKIKSETAQKNYLDNIIHYIENQIIPFLDTAYSKAAQELNQKNKEVDNLFYSLQKNLTDLKNCTSSN
ncbi:dynamin family protein [Ornithobacterium rhinotracheale]|uniref:Dynamin family protein n=1 Tax=Ornithobacterium rhinotracheale (strain ATCC 51463 / DSM 15997 / CCUG 23171 / CIP 104009 / LMG 9086) TaxID=867902 RepID=I4A1U5_ORNRL|nr:dynamin family protein [Ornithobacterium rhinotracheale]AFL97929.1 dynamin family protein [Ornithobacterium rhinotracheale DSM 15997]AIQ00632.1 hypothetical protein Q785_08740 [Ornithobacterium rhinotracheale ORT-UMN 88]KGB66226.1 hypothetical protein Q787_08555 [Ornithobacterium rhinotracheale H06-030791]MCK0193780.1 dynamin family protein [Ornithobacterium rhinotracheale]